jgi:hypothetical protein
VKRKIPWPDIREILVFGFNSLTHTQVRFCVKLSMIIMLKTPLGRPRYRWEDNFRLNLLVQVLISQTVCSTKLRHAGIHLPLLSSVGSRNSGLKRNLQSRLSLVLKEAFS